MVLTIPLHYLEKQQMRKWFLSSQVAETKNIIIMYLDQKRQVLFRMGWEVSRLQLALAALAIIDFMAVLPIAFHEPWILSLIFALIGALAFDLGSRLYGLRFNIRFEKGLRTSVLLIGIESLTATGEAETAIDDILRLSRDKVMLREFEAVKTIMGALQISCEEAMLVRAEDLKVPAYRWLARYTLKMRQFGANTGEAWQDVLEELEDRDLLRARTLSKTASTRYGAYAFGGVLIIVLLLFFHLIAPLMTGVMSFIFTAGLLSTAVGIYRLTRLGVDVK